MTRCNKERASNLGLRVVVAALCSALSGSLLAAEAAQSQPAQSQAAQSGAAMDQATSGGTAKGGAAVSEAAKGEGGPDARNLWREPVTGSMIVRPNAGDAQPLIKLDRRYIDQSGASNAPELIRSVPAMQNSGGVVSSGGSR